MDKWLSTIFVRLVGAASVLFSGLCFAGKCIIVSGLKHDDVGFFGNYKTSGCQVVYSFSEIEKMNLEGQVLDLRVLAHGDIKMDGSVVVGESCKMSESPKDVVNSLNRIAKNNRLFASFGSCFSDQVMKERILFDQNHPLESNYLIDRSCFSSASSAKNTAESSVKSLIQSQFFSKIKNTKIVDLFSSVETGLLSGAPFNTAGITDAWKDNGKNNALSLSKFSETISKLPTESENIQHQLLLLLPKLSSEQFSNLSDNINILMEMDLKSIQKLARLVDEFASPEEINELEKQKWNMKAMVDFIQNHPNVESEKVYTSNLDGYALQALREIRKTLESPNPQTSFKSKYFSDALDPKTLLNQLDVAFKGVPFKKDSNQMYRLIGGEGTEQAEHPSNVMGWTRALGIFSRFSVKSITEKKYSPTDPIDQRRFAACDNFHYDDKASLQFGEKFGEPKDGGNH